MDFESRRIVRALLIAAALTCTDSAEIDQASFHMAH
jgi:hypothetical protein